MIQAIENISGSAKKEEAVQLHWHLITSEYPPQKGGVSDYTYGVAAGLAAQGDEVHVWCPGGADPAFQGEHVVVHPEFGAFGPADLRRVGQQLDRFPAPRRILVQWVPHGYGYKSMNVAFCWWLCNRARMGDRVEIMAHEAFHAFHEGSWKQDVAALIHRLMTILLLRAAERVWVAIPDWESCWRPYRFGRPIPFQWLPVPSNIPVADDPAAVQAIRRRYAADGSFLIGHFGTHGPSIVSLLDPILSALAGDPVKQGVLFMGVGSEECRQGLIRRNPALAKMIHATGPLPASDLSCHLAACDLLIQPYPDGVNTRRGSFMAGLSHGKPAVTTIGRLSESFWSETGALALAPERQVEAFVDSVRQLRADAGERARMGGAARVLYQQRFDISHVIMTLREAAGADGRLTCGS